MNWVRWEGLVLIIVAIFGFLAVQGVVLKPKEPEGRSGSWRDDYGKIINTLCFIMIIVGIISLLGWFN